MAKVPLVKCAKCGAEGVKERMQEEGNHHKRSCLLFRPYLLVHCKSCGVGGGPGWIMTSGRHHAWSCPRYSSSSVGACKFCGFLGDVSMVQGVGPHHSKGCKRFGVGNADSPKVTMCKYCGFRGPVAMVTGIGDQHSKSCLRNPSRVARAKKEPHEGAVSPSWSWMACFCCGIDTTTGDVGEVAFINTRNEDPPQAQQAIKEDHLAEDDEKDLQKEDIPIEVAPGRNNMVLPRSPTRRIRGKASPRVIHWVTKDEHLPLRQAQRLLPRLYTATKGATFDAEAFCSWMATQIQSKIPTVEEANSLLAKLSRSRRHENQLRPAPAAWIPTGIRFEDQEGEANIQNVSGFEWQTVGPSKCFAWNEYGWVYRLKPQDQGLYSVVRSKAFKRASALVSKRTVTADKKTNFKSCVVMDLPPGRCISEPKWSLIYLHSFSQKGTDYLNFPHYFNVCGASLRVLMPTAPLLEQQCFKDWYVWRGGHLGWRRIKFNAWFDYITDKGGVAENTICEDSLLSIRERLHKLIRHEVQRVGDPRRVIVGGQSQGCCAALDATLTFEQEVS
eukprot:symbB.v1.2.004139.t1/scaffold218.1/size262896/7